MTRGRLLLVALWCLGLVVLALALERPAPLFLNLGPGDEPFARGFRAGWERDGLAQSGDTTFRWTEDGARLEFPVEVRSGRLTARFRLARFADTEADITLLVNGSIVERWTQPARGWAVRRFDLGEVRGPLMLRFRSETSGGDALGVALDWVEIEGAATVIPRRERLLGLAAGLFACPLVVAIFTSAGVGLAIGTLGAWAAAAAIAVDRLGGLEAASAGGVPAALVLLALGLVHQTLARCWPDALGDRSALIVPSSAAWLLALLFFHPFFYYPDVDTHARFVAAIRADPRTAVDAREFQTRTGAWTRTIADKKVAFPYAPFFHLVAWPAAAVLGEVAAIKVVALVSIGTTLLLGFGLARALGIEPAWALLGQGLLAILPVTISRFSLALYPTLFGQAFEALLLLHLVRRFGHLDGARAAAVAAAFLLAAQAAYTGSLFSVAALVVAIVAIETLGGERARAIRLAAACAGAAALVFLLLYARFLPTLLRDVLPFAGASASETVEGFSTSGRLLQFYGPLLPLLALGGLAAATGAPSHARRILGAALLAGALLLVLRSALPTLFRDAKDVELLAMPVAVLAAAALRRLWQAGEAGRIAAVGALAVVLVFVIPRDAALYAARFLAIGR